MTPEPYYRAYAGHYNAPGEETYGRWQWTGQDLAAACALLAEYQ